MKDGLKKIIGKDIVGVVVATNTRNPTQQVFLTFSDGTHFEFWGDSFSCASGLDHGDHTVAIDYVQRAGGKITASYGSATVVDQLTQTDTASQRSSTQSSSSQGKNMSAEAVRIKKYVHARGIESLTHFTKIVNIPGILTNGVLGRQTLASRGLNVETNDQYRYDRVPDAVCASISFPNYKMFYGLQQSNPESDWAVLRIDPRVLWEIPCAYCATNAASNEVTCVPLEDRMTLDALKAMFEDAAPDIERASLGIPDEFATNPQAEVLILGPIDPSYIININVNAKDKIRDLNALQRLFKPYFGKFKFLHDGSLFTYRKDYEHWRRPKESSNDQDIDFDKLFNF